MDKVDWNARWENLESKAQIHTELMSGLSLDKKLKCFVDGKFSI